MARPFIEFVQVQNLPWRQGLPEGHRAGVESRVLSFDDDSGASSLLVRYPAGFSAPDPFTLNVDEELFVLDGDLTIGDRAYGIKSYAHLPAGHRRTSMSSRDGAVALTFLSGAADVRTPGGTGESGHAHEDVDTARLVEYVDAFAGDWGGNFHPKFPPGAGRKFLRRDPHDGEETWILGTMPLRSGRRPEKHPVVEEMYLLSGELVGPLGRMQAGAYFWRPPEEWHGPFGSPTGNLMLFRTKGGPLSTVYTEDEVEFTWTPEHHPILPPDLEPYGQPIAGCGCY